MRLKNGIVMLDDAVGFSPSHDTVLYTDVQGNRVSIPLKVVVRLYEGSKYHLEKLGINWSELCDTLFTEERPK